MLIFFIGLIIALIYGSVSSIYPLSFAFILTISVIFLKLKNQAQLVWLITGILAMIVGFGNLVIVYLFSLPIIFTIPGIFIALAGAISLRLLKLRLGFLF